MAWTDATSGETVPGFYEEVPSDKHKKLLRRVANFTATYRDDGRQFACRLTVEKPVYTDMCNVTLSVTCKYHITSSVFLQL